MMNNKEFTCYEMMTFRNTWLILPPEQRLIFEKILEQENPNAYKKFKKEVLSELTDKDTFLPY